MCLYLSLSLCFFLFSLPLSLSLSLSLSSSPGHEGSAKPLGLVAPPDVGGAFGGVCLSLSISFLSLSLSYEGNAPRPCSPPRCSWGFWRSVSLSLPLSLSLS